MTPIQKIELQVLELHGQLDLRPTIAKAAQLGLLLVQAKASLPHGQW